MGGLHDIGCVDVVVVGVVGAVLTLHRRQEADQHALLHLQHVLEEVTLTEDGKADCGRVEGWKGGWA